jgi:hypothetical protein
MSVFFSIVNIYFVYFCVSPGFRCVEMLGEFVLFIKDYQINVSWYILMTVNQLKTNNKLCRKLFLSVLIHIQSKQEQVSIFYIVTVMCRCRALICRDTKYSVHFCASAGKFMVKTQLENMELFSIPALVSTFDMFDCFVSLEPDFWPERKIVWHTIWGAIPCWKGVMVDEATTSYRTLSKCYFVLCIATQIQKSLLLKISHNNLSQSSSVQSIVVMGDFNEDIRKPQHPVHEFHQSQLSTGDK